MHADRIALTPLKSDPAYTKTGLTLRAKVFPSPSWMDLGKIRSVQGNRYSFLANEIFTDGNGHAIPPIEGKCRS